MTSDRAYRKALSREAALKEVCRHAGSQFDADLVGLFCRNLPTELHLLPGLNMTRAIASAARRGWSTIPPDVYSFNPEDD